MLLCIDIGNSTIGLALFSDESKYKKPSVYKIPTYPTRSKSFYKRVIHNFIKQNTTINEEFKTDRINSVIGSVVPSVNKVIVEALKDIQHKRPLLLNRSLNYGIKFDVSFPHKIGPDRIANAVAGIYHFKERFAVVDCGTATTITVVGRNKDFLGGTIMPGLNLMKKSLHSDTARLPLIKLSMPKSIIGKDTVSAMQSGIIMGTAGAIENIIKGMENELGFRLKLIMTGGHSELISPFIKKRHILIPDLTFEGMRLIYLQNR